MLKFKLFETEDVIIVDAEEGTGKYEGMLGAFVAMLGDSLPGGFLPIEQSLHVGSGYTDEQRIMYWRERHALIGRTIEIKFQNKTAKGSRRFPTFIRLRPDKDGD